MSEESIHVLFSREEDAKEDISRFSCQKAKVDFCPKRVELDHLRNETGKQLASALKNSEKYREYFQILLSSVKSLMKPHTIILNIFKSQLAKVPLKARYSFQTQQTIRIWLFVEEDNWEVEENIYEAYGELLDFFPEMEIDLRLLKLYGREPRELLPEGFKPW